MLSFGGLRILLNLHLAATIVGTLVETDAIVHLIREIGIRIHTLSMMTLRLFAQTGILRYMMMLSIKSEKK